MCAFEDLCSLGLLTLGNHLQKAVLYFTFSNLIQRHLEEVRIDWNSHTLQRSRGAICPSGKPNELFFSPPDGFHDQKRMYDVVHFEFLRDQSRQPPIALDVTIHEQCLNLMNENVLEMPNNRREGVRLYLKLLELFNALPNIAQ